MLGAPYILVNSREKLNYVLINLAIRNQMKFFTNKFMEWLYFGKIFYLIIKVMEIMNKSIPHQDKLDYW